MDAGLLARTTFEPKSSHPRFLPDPDLSKAVQSRVVEAFRTAWEQPPGVFSGFGRLLGIAGGRMRYWRLR